MAYCDQGIRIAHFVSAASCGSAAKVMEYIELAASLRLNPDALRARVRLDTRKSTMEYPPALIEELEALYLLHHDDSGQKISQAGNMTLEEIGNRHNVIGHVAMSIYGEICENRGMYQVTVPALQEKLKLARDEIALLKSERNDALETSKQSSETARKATELATQLERDLNACRNARVQITRKLAEAKEIVARLTADKESLATTIRNL